MYSYTIYIYIYSLGRYWVRWSEGSGGRIGEFGNTFDFILTNYIHTNIHMYIQFSICVLWNWPSRVPKEIEVQLELGDLK